MDEENADSPDASATVAAQIAAQIGRPLRADSRVVSRCHLGLPVVVRVPPVLDDGTPFPTSFWLSCPLAHRRIARLEAAGEVRVWEAKIAADPVLSDAMQAAHRAYAEARDAAVPPDAVHRPEGGIAGLRGTGLKCLHAHYAHARAGGSNPVGRGVLETIEPLNCEHPCVQGAARNPDWREPER